MNEEIREEINAENTPAKDKTKPEKQKKKKSSFVRVLTMILVICFAVFAAVIISDFAGRYKQESTTEQTETGFIIHISAEEIFVEDGKKVTLAELEAMLDEAKAQGDFPEINIITDTGSPASSELYNQLADLLAKYDVHIERMYTSSTADEMGLSTKDEESY